MLPLPCQHSPGLLCAGLLSGLASPVNGVAPGTLGPYLACDWHLMYA